MILLTLERLAFAFLSTFDVVVSLFRMARWPINLLLMSCACDSILLMNFAWWLRTVFLAAKLIRGMWRCSGVPNFATSDLFNTVSCWPGTLMVTVLSVVSTNATPSGIASYRP